MKMNTSVLDVVLVLACLIIVLATCDTKDSLEVETRQGVLKGKQWKTCKGRIFVGFTGIPFAKPPIGDLRFKVSICSLLEFKKSRLFNMLLAR